MVEVEWIYRESKGGRGKRRRKSWDKYPLDELMTCCKLLVVVTFTAYMGQTTLTCLPLEPLSKYARRQTTCRHNNNNNNNNKNTNETM